MMTAAGLAGPARAERRGKLGPGTVGPVTAISDWRLACRVAAPARSRRAMAERKRKPCCNGTVTKIFAGSNPKRGGAVPRGSTSGIARIDAQAKQSLLPGVGTSYYIALAAQRERHQIQERRKTECNRVK